MSPAGAGLRSTYRTFHKAVCSLYGREALALAADDRPFDFDDSLFDKAAEKVYRDGGFEAAALAEPQARALIGEVQRVLGTAIGSALPHEVPQTLRHALENNAFIFSGFKTFHALRELGLSLTTDKGDIKPFNDFLKDVKRINERYNRNYLRAEYNHAVSASQMAARWHDFEQDGDRYDLQYRTAGDDRVREEHAALHGTTLPPSDPFWSMFLPPNGWNCRCSAVQVRKNKYPASDPELAMKRGMECTEGVKKAIFRYNAGKSLQIFPPKHPYYKVPKDDKKVIEQVVEQLIKTRSVKEPLSDAQKARRREIQQKAATTLIGKQFRISGFKKPLNISKRGIKEWLNQPYNDVATKNEALLNLANIMGHAVYKGHGVDKRTPTAIVHIFEVMLNGNPSWVVVREFTDGSCRIHSISDNSSILEYITTKKP